MSHFALTPGGDKCVYVVRIANVFPSVSSHDVDVCHELTYMNTPDVAFGTQQAGSVLRTTCSVLLLHTRSSPTHRHFLNAAAIMEFVRAYD